MALVKICGLFRDEDVEYVNEAKPDFAGFVFATSRRRVDVKTAARLRENLIEEIAPVGVFVDAPLDEVAMLWDSGVIEFAQLHGNESAEYVRALRQRCGAQIIKAVRVDEATDFTLYEAYGADYLLFDNGGGTGERFDWSLLPPLRKPFFLAGGLGPDNVVEAILAVQPYAVDLSSGVETDGFKERQKIIDTVRSVRNG